MDLYVVRHGETQWNFEKRMQGRLDSTLTKKGINDALLLSERLKQTDFQQIITSPSTRARKTAELLKGKRSVPLTTDERLLEIHLGLWQGKTETEIKQQFPEQYEYYWRNPARFENSAGENFLNVKSRVSEFLDETERRFRSGNILVVTHGVVIKTLLLICKNAEIEEIWNPPLIGGTSLTVIRIGTGSKILLMEGCDKHLEY